MFAICASTCDDLSVSTIAERVHELVVLSGQTQRAFARAIDLDETKLSKSLSGMRSFTSLELALVAEHCSVGVDWLITGEDPALAMAARSTGGSARRAVEEAERLSEHRRGLSWLGYAAPWRPVERPATSGRWVDDAVALAGAALERVREAGRCETEDDLPLLVEDVFGADVAVVDLDEDFDGLAVSTPGSEMILLGATHRSARQRFTLAHELGHLLAGDDQEVRVEQDVRDAQRLKDPAEKRADAFAAAFLMPEEALRAAAAAAGGLDERVFAGLACERAVSPVSLAWRLRDVGLVDDEARERFGAMTAATAASLAGRGDEFSRRAIESGEPRLPGLLTRDAYDAYSTARTTLRPYAALIGADLDQLRRVLEENDVAVP